MATIGQIVDYMNGEGMIWHPVKVVDISVSSGGECCYIKGEENLLYERSDGRQKFIGHYYVWNNDGNEVSGIVLLPLNNNRYLKAVILELS